MIVSHITANIIARHKRHINKQKTNLSYAATKTTSALGENNEKSNNIAHEHKKLRPDQLWQLGSLLRHRTQVCQVKEPTKIANTVAQPSRQIRIYTSQRKPAAQDAQHNTNHCEWAEHHRHTLPNLSNTQSPQQNLICTNLKAKPQGANSDHTESDKIERTSPNSSATFILNITSDEKEITSKNRIIKYQETRTCARRNRPTGPRSRSTTLGHRTLHDEIKTMKPLISHQMTSAPGRADKKQRQVGSTSGRVGKQRNPLRHPDQSSKTTTQLNIQDELNDKLNSCHTDEITG